MKATLLAGISLVLVGCDADLNRATEAAQITVDSLVDSHVYLPITISALESAVANADAAFNAQTLGTSLEINNNGCVTVDDQNVPGSAIVLWDCDLPEGAQTVKLSGGSRTDVESNAQSATYTTTSIGMNVGGAFISDVSSVLSFDFNASTATLTHSDKLFPGTEISFDATITFIDNGVDSSQISIDGTRLVNVDGQAHTQTWTDVTFEAGLRLPISGKIAIDGLRGGPYDVNLLSTEPGKLVIEVTTQDGSFFDFNTAQEGGFDVVSFIR